MGDRASLSLAVVRYFSELAKSPAAKAATPASSYTCLLLHLLSMSTLARRKASR